MHLNIFRWRPIAVRGFLLALSAIACLSGCAGLQGDPLMIVRTASVSGDELRLVVFSGVVQSRPFLGDQVHRQREHYLRYRIRPDSGPLQLISIEELPEPHGNQDANEFVFSQSGDRIVRIREIQTVVVEDKAYASGEVDVLALDAAVNRWRRLATWKRQLILISPSGARMVAKGSGKTIAYDLAATPIGQLKTDQDLNALFAAAGSTWDEIRPDLPNLEADSPPDYLGLTDDLEYASSDDGIVSYGFVYNKTSVKRSPIVRRIPVPGSEWPAYEKQVRKVGGEWQYLYIQVTPDDRGGAIRNRR
jgi:hypothetical protein